MENINVVRTQLLKEFKMLKEMQSKSEDAAQLYPVGSSLRNYHLNHAVSLRNRRHELTKWYLYLNQI